MLCFFCKLTFLQWFYCFKLAQCVFELLYLIILFCNSCVFLSFNLGLVLWTRKVFLLFLFVVVLVHQIIYVVVSGGGSTFLSLSRNIDHLLFVIFLFRTRSSLCLRWIHVFCFFLDGLLDCSHGLVFSIIFLNESVTLTYCNK